MDSANTPAAPPPPGQHSNLAIAPTQANAIVITLIVCIVLTTPLIVLRIVARFIFDRRFWLDDGKMPGQSRCVIQTPLNQL